MEVKTLFTLTLPNKVANVHEWSQKIGLFPLQSVVKGEKLPDESGEQIAKDSVWAFGVNRRPETAVEEQLSQVVNEVYARKEQIQKLVKGQGLEMKFETFAWFQDEDDYIDFGRDIFKKISELGASFKLKFC